MSRSNFRTFRNFPMVGRYQSRVIACRTAHEVCVVEDDGNYMADVSARRVELATWTGRDNLAAVSAAGEADGGADQAGVRADRARSTAVATARVWRCQPARAFTLEPCLLWCAKLGNFISAS
jgi:hypothetical protein